MSRALLWRGPEVAEDEARGAVEVLAPRAMPSDVPACPLLSGGEGTVDYAMPYNAILCYVMPCHAMLHHVAL